MCDQTRIFLGMYLLQFWVMSVRLVILCAALAGIPIGVAAAAPTGKSITRKISRPEGKYRLKHSISSNQVISSIKQSQANSYQNR